VAANNNVPNTLIIIREVSRLFSPPRINVLPAAPGR
jgi:hypothetical protein